MDKERLDVLIAQRGLAEDRSHAQKLVMAGQVRVGGQLIFKPDTRFPPDVDIQIDQGPRYVSRGGEKLEAALAAFHRTDLAGIVCADVGASTGGFTDCLLQHGAGKVYAVDVGYGELHWKLRSDPRVVVMERTNARHLQKLPEPVSLVTIDASFISLRVLLPAAARWLPEGGGEVIALIKPQFEAERKEVSRGEGVIQDPQIHRRILMGVLEFAGGIGMGATGLIRSPLKGPKGNTEFLVHFICPGEAAEPLDSMTARAAAPEID